MGAATALSVVAITDTDATQMSTTLTNEHRVVSESISKVQVHLDARALLESAELFSVSLEAQLPNRWTNSLHNEFRALALREAKGEISPEESHRLNELSHWRNLLVSPRSPDEIQLELKRNRLLKNLSGALEEYVEFQQSQNR